MNSKKLQRIEHFFFDLNQLQDKYGVRMEGKADGSFELYLVEDLEYKVCVRKLVENFKYYFIKNI